MVYGAGLLSADCNRDQPSPGPIRPVAASAATANTASTWSSRSADAPATVTDVVTSCSPGSDTISAVGITMIPAALTSLVSATRRRVSRR